eukprot:SAG11_NODE_19420_length_467_cov_0.622283_2_plen_34_part_01
MHGERAVALASRPLPKRLAAELRRVAATLGRARR